MLQYIYASSTIRPVIVVPFNTATPHPYPTISVSCVESRFTREDKYRDIVVNTTVRDAPLSINSDLHCVYRDLEYAHC